MTISNSFYFRPTHWKTTPLLFRVGLLLFTFAMSSITQAGAAFQHISLDERLGGEGIGAIKAIVQDDIGFIWIGGEYGLARFDGHEFSRYSADEQYAGRKDGLLSNYINDIVFDLDGVMWVATDRGLNYYVPETDHFAVFKQDQHRQRNSRVAALAVDQKNNLILALDDGVTVINPKRTLIRHFATPQSDPQNYISVRTLFVDSRNRVWIGSKGAGAAILDIRTGNFRFFSHSPSNRASILSNHISAIGEDQEGDLWFGAHTGGISQLKQGQTYFTHYANQHSTHDIGAYPIWDIFTDANGVTWVATDQGGLARFNKETRRFEHLMHSPYDPRSLGSNQIRNIFEDHNGDLWIGLFPNGLSILKRTAAPFNNYIHRPDDSNSLSHSAILAILEDRQGRVWVGTENGLNQFDRENQLFERHTSNLESPHGLKANAVLSLEEDASGRIWVGTWSGGVHLFDPASGRFRHFAEDGTDPTSLSNDFVWTIVRDQQDRIWLGTEGGGLNLYQPESEDFLVFRHNTMNSNSLDSDFIWSMICDSDGNLWAGTTQGLNRIDPETLQIHRYQKNVGDPTTFNGSRVRALFEDSRQRIWIGTQDNGMYTYDKKTKRFRSFANNAALPAQYVTGFIEDQSGSIWASTTHGLVKVNPDSMRIEIIQKSQGLVGNNFNREANHIDEQGNVYFGAAEGLTVFNPEHLQTRQSESYPLVFTKLQLFNRDVDISQKDSPLQSALWFTRSLTLNHLHTMFSVDFALLQFDQSASIEYAYKLDGFDGGWINTGTQNSAVFTNLNPGHYSLKVKAKLNGVWNESQPTLDIRVLPPPWRTGWAYLLYALALLILLYVLISSFYKRAQLKSERALNQELKNLNEIKDAFLANTSHELRTPLNGIIGIAEALQERMQGKDDYASRHLHLISTSGKRLANLINDILDYSKLAKRNLDLNRKPVDLKHTLENVFSLLSPLTLTTTDVIKLMHRLPDNLPKVYADENRLQQILINLIGNGIKYTTSGHVSVDMTTEGGYARISVEDTGVGIEKSKYQELFEAFSQLQNPAALEIGGTGLGLAITKQLIELHDGTIWLDETYQHGARFCFTLPLSESDTDHGRPASADKIAPPTATVSTHQRPQRVIELKAPRNSSEHTILVVDDDPVNRMVMAEMLNAHQYRVMEAGGGIEALETLQKHPEIDLIIMDIMMPHISGLDTCARIRETHALYEIPIIFLTANRDTGEDLQRCFDVGGNEYITKPVSKYDLLPRVANLLRIQRIIRKLQLALESNKNKDTYKNAK